MRLCVRQSHRARNAGSAVVVMIALLGLMLVFVGANLKTLHFLKREIKLIETRQVHRLARQHPVTSNTVTNDTSIPLPTPVRETNAPTTR
jgi:cell division protein FtsN